MKEELTPEEEKRFYDKAFNREPTMKDLMEKIKTLEAHLLAHKCTPCIHQYHFPQQPYQQPQTHWHNGIPCVLNPCVWC